jgi:transposase
VIIADSRKVFLACGPTDMRKQINGLVEQVTSAFELDAFSGALFVFCNRRRDIIRILEWDADGFWLHTKRLERGRFIWPGPARADRTLPVCSADLAQIISQTVLERRIRGDEVTERCVH